MKKGFVISILFAAAISASAQDFKFLQEKEPWLSGTNAAGLTRFGGSRISIVEGGYSKDNGGLIGTNESKDSYGAGIETESYMKYSDRMVFQGRLFWSSDEGKNMGGPVFMDPSYNSFNIYETTSETAGKKTRELYGLAAGLGYRISDRISLGGRIKYDCGDQTKKRDPRTLNKWMDLGLSAGLDWVVSDNMRLGADLRYRRTLEQITAGKYGMIDTDYFMYVDYGAGLSVKEIFQNDEGHISLSNSRPLSNSFYGAGFQMEIGHRNKFTNEVSFLHRTGYFGKKSSTSVVFEECSGNEISYKGSFLRYGAGSLDKAWVDAALTTLNGERSVYTKVYQAGEETRISYADPQKSLDRTLINVEMGYTRYTGVKQNSFAYKYGAAVNLIGNKTKATYYPFYRNQNYTTAEITAFIQRNLSLKKGVLSLDAQAYFKTGSGKAAEDGAYASTSSTNVVSADNWLYWQYDYETLSRAGVGLGIKHTKPIKSVKAYIGVNDNFTTLLADSDNLPGTKRNSIKLIIGCIF